MELIGPYLAGCLLLVAAGCAKAWRPDDTALALAELVPFGPRMLRRTVRVTAGVEALLGASALVAPRPVLSGAVAASYAAFAAFVTYARRRGGALSSCGCFGTPDTPATRLHIVVDLGLAACAVAVTLAATAAHAPGLVTDVLDHEPLRGGPLVLASAVCAWVLYISLSTLPKMQAARRLVTGTEP